MAQQEQQNDDTFFTLSKVSEGLYKEKGSKFLAFAYPVASETAIKARLEELRKTYYDARHHCYAYILGPKMESYRANDDGEPNHSAGDPILGQIRSHQLTNTLIVVVRYFGGTKLGVSGLIQAYKTAAAEAIANNEILQAFTTTEINFHFDYLQMNEVMKIMKDYPVEILAQNFDNQCSMSLRLRASMAPSFLAKLEDVGINVFSEE